MPRRRTPFGQTRERVLDFMREQLASGCAPSLREVQKALGFRALETAREHLDKLVSEGRLEKREGLARSYRLPRRAAGAALSSGAFSSASSSGAFGSAHANPLQWIPLLGRVQAGALTLAQQEIEGYLPLWPQASTRARSARASAPGRAHEFFALRVRGQSMRGAGILEGDIAIARRQATAEHGDIVVAQIGEEATLKRLYRRGRRLELRPENPDFEAIAVAPGEELVLLGKLVELRRYLAGAPVFDRPQ